MDTQFMATYADVRSCASAALKRVDVLRGHL